MTTGSGSNFQLTRLAAKYNEIQNSGRILSNRHSMDIIAMRVQQLAEDIDAKDAPEKMERLATLWKDYREKQANGKEVEAMLVANDIDDEFEKAYYLFQAWRQMFQALELHSKMTESEVKIMKDLRAIMTAEDAYELVAKVMAVMLRVLQDDPKRLKEAQFELNRIVGGEIDSRFGSRSGTRAGSDGSSELDREGIFDPGDAQGLEITRTDETGRVPEGRDPGDIQPG